MGFADTRVPGLTRGVRRVDIPNMRIRGVRADGARW
jgi:hypothetical protein